MKSNPEGYRDQEYYSGVYWNPKFNKKYLCPAEESGYWDLVWAPAFKALRTYWETLRRTMPLAVIELGTGTGQFADLIERRPNLEFLYGVDFAEGAVTLARTMFPELRDRFMVDDFFSDGHLDWRQGMAADAVVCLEVLEHLPDEDDLRLLRECVMPGEFFVGSVPSFLCDGHVRAFESQQEVRQRYMRYIDIEDMTQATSAGDHWFTFWGKRK